MPPILLVFLTFPENGDDIHCADLSLWNIMEGLVILYAGMIVYGAVPSR